MTEDATRRQLTFSLFLQGFAALMLGAASVVRVLAFGLDLLTLVLVAAFVVVLGAGWYTWSRLRMIGRKSS